MLRSRRTGISLNWRPRLDRTDSSASPSPGLTAIDDKPSEFFADWLVVGIRFDLFGPDMMRAFPGAQRYVGKRDLLVDDLAAIWRMLAPDTQLAFANGAADGLKRLDFADRGDALVARELLSLAGRIRAHAVLAMFARCSDQGFATAPGGELLSMAVDLIADLATHDDAVAERALARLADAEGFTSMHARRALPALCKANPAGLAQHLRRLHPPLQAYFAPSVCNEAKTPRRVAERAAFVAKIVGAVVGQVGVAPIDESIDCWSERASAGFHGSIRGQEADWWCAEIMSGRQLDSLRNCVR